MQYLMQMRKGAGPGRDPEEVVLPQLGVGSNKEPSCHWSWVSLTEGRGGRWEVWRCWVTSVNPNRHRSHPQETAIPPGGRRKLNGCTNELSDYTNKWNKGPQREVHGMWTPMVGGIFVQEVHARKLPWGHEMKTTSTEKDQTLRMREPLCLSSWRKARWGLELGGVREGGWPESEGSQCQTYRAFCGS